MVTNTRGRGRLVVGAVGGAKRLRSQRRRSRQPLTHREGFIAAVMLAPAALVLVVLRIYPTIEAVLSSFEIQPLNVLEPAHFAGLANYKFLLFHSPTFWTSVVVTILFVALVVLVQTVGSLLLAVLYTQSSFATKLWRGLVFLPITFPMAVSTVVWQIALRNDGIVNAFLSAIGIGQYSFFASRGMAYLAFLIILSWIGLGYWMVLLIAGLAEVPQEIRDAARVDGAGPIRSFFSVVLPLLKRPLAFVAVALTVTNFFTFVPEAVITQGGPRGATRFLMFDIYEQAYSNGNLNLASAEIVIFAVIVLAIVAAEFKLIAPEDV